MCGLGRLYSKQRVIEALLNKDELPAELQHIKSMKDIKDLKLTLNPAYSAEDEKNAPFICALIGLEMSGQFRFVALWSCGCELNALNFTMSNLLIKFSLQVSSASAPSRSSKPASAQSARSPTPTTTWSFSTAPTKTLNSCVQKWTSVRQTQRH